MSLRAVPEISFEADAAQTIGRLSDLVEVEMRERGCAPASIEEALREARLWSG